MTTARIWVDFMKTDDAGRLLLASRGTIEDLERHGIELCEGMVLQVYSDDSGDNGQRDDLQAEGVVRRDAQAGRWVLEIDWDGIRHQSDSPSSE